MTDPSDQLAPPALDVDLGSSNGHLASGDELPSMGDVHVVVDIESSVLPLALTTDGIMNSCRKDKTMASQSRVDGLEYSDSTLCSEGVKNPRLFARNALTPPSGTIQSENQLQKNSQGDFWSEILVDAPAMLGLPTDRPRPTQVSTDLSNVSIHLDVPLTRSLKRLAMDHDTDLGIVIMTCWSAVLSLLSGQDDIVIGFHSGTFGQSDVRCLEDRILPLRMDLSGEPNTTQLLGRVQEIVSSAMSHQDLTLGRSPDVGDPSRRSVPPVFQVAFQWQGQEKCTSTSMKTTSSAAHLDLHLQLQELDNEVKGSMRFSSALFNSSTINRHVGYLTAMMRSMVEDTTRPFETFDILSPSERRLLLETRNETLETYSDHLCFHQLFELQAGKTPTATAIVHEGHVLSYSELNSRANRLAHHLIELGVRIETRVAICVDRSPGMIIGILGIMKAGGAYVPIDPKYSSGRINDILQDASPTIAVADNTGQSVLRGSSITMVDPNALPNTSISSPTIPGLTSRNLAYIIYTSGSTGKPKGVMIEHRGAVSLTQTHTKFYGIHQDSRILQFASCGFDASVWDILLSLTNGASLYLPPEVVRQDRKECWDYMKKHGITLAAPPPSFLQDGKDLPMYDIPLTLVLGGEALNRSLLQNLLSRGCTVINDYGPTETTVTAVTWCCPPDFTDSVIPIGRPIGNTRVYLLDKYQQPVPSGAPGEMYIGGVSVARGYLNKPELSAERFLKDPFTRDGEARMYRTGDLARYLPDGNIVFLGRNDDQIKIRGFRVEPGEIETHLSDHQLVEKAAVFALGEGSSKRLVAYVVAKPQDKLVHTLRSHLTSRLPEYMVPAAIVRLDTLPLTTSGKIDRKALPEPDSGAFAREVYDEPRGEIETTLARIWGELLSLHSVSRNDDFFALGGHSLLVVRMIEGLHHVGLSVSVSTVYGSPVLSVLAQAIEEHLPESIPSNLIPSVTEKLTPEMLSLIDLTQDDIDRIIGQTSGGLANIADIYSLSPLQDGILFHHLLATHGDPYLLSTEMAFVSRELLDRYLQAFQKVVDRHDILRTAFVWRNTSTPAQVVWRRAHVPVQELALDPADGPIMKQLDDRFHPNHYRIDLTQAPLLQFIVSQDTDGRWLLYQLVHHLIGDHEAAEMINHEVKQILSGQEHKLPTSQPFRNIIVQARRSSGLDVHERFFREILGDIDEPTFPFGISEINHNGANITESHSILPQDLNNRLRSQAKEMGVSVASLCHVAWSQVLVRTAGQERVVFGTVLFGGEQGSERAMGLSINTLPFRCDIDSHNVRKCVRQAHVRLASLLEHKYASLPLAQKCSGVPSGTPLFSSIMNYLHTSLPTTASSEWSGMEFISQEEQVHFPGIEVLGGRERTNYPVTLTVEDFGTALGLTVQTLEPIDPGRVGSYMKRALESLAEALESTSDMTTSELEVLPLEERELLVHGLNSFVMDYPQHQTIHDLFEEQVERTPRATALVFNDQTLTYSELNEHSNRLAHHLIGLGVQPDSLVAICVDRSLAMVIGVLAVLKAGGAFVPLVSTYASERLKDILKDADPKIVIADESGRGALGDDELMSRTVVDPNAEVIEGYKSIHDYPTSNPKVSGLTANHLVYVIYTSGSTGKPKGVMIEHQGMVNLIMTRPDVFDISASSRVAQFFSFAFDGCAMDIFTALCHGGSLHLMSDTIRSDPVQMWSYLQNQSISQVILTPTVLQNCKDLTPLSTLQTLIVGGEALPATLIHTLQSLVPNGRIVNDYGPTEATVSSVAWKCPPRFGGDTVSIGRPIGNKRVYILNEHGLPVPLGVIGELYIGGVGVARGYLNRPDLTAKAFLPDPFAENEGARMYKTGDMARYLPDGNIVFLGRNDHQVKIRGFRIELGEIEARLVDHPLVETAIIVVIGDGSDKKLVAYVVAQPKDELVRTLRSHLKSCLPDYMVPAAIVRLDSLPLTHNGKIDLKALPAPDGDAFARQVYEEPQGEIETAVAHIWCELLSIDRVSRNDNFFALGGHSLLVVRLIERLRHIGLTLTIRTLFKAPTLRVVVESLQSHQGHVVPVNLITDHTTTITPEMLPLINLSQNDIEIISERVPGGVSNIQDIYALSPLQEGILFHHLLATEGDPYLLIASMVFDTREILDNYMNAIQKVVDRHDILRTAFMWENLSTPVQVVLRRAQLSITELQLDHCDGPVKDQLMQRLDPRKHRIDLNQAPLLRFTVAQDTDGRWIGVQLLHHLIGDHSTLDVMNTEIKAFMGGQGHTLRPPQPFRNLIAQSRSNQRQDDHDNFFSEMLSDIDIPSLPFGLEKVHGQGNDVTTSYRLLPQDLNDRLRKQAKRLGVSVATLCHLAWAIVISRTSGEDRVVFGTVLFGRMHSGIGADEAMGLFINTLPIRIDLTGSVREGVIRTHERLASLLEHEHASLVRAQQCSSVPHGTPLFSAMLNYRHNVVASDVDSAIQGIEHLEAHERTNYPLTLSVEDFGMELGLTADVVCPIDADRICGYMQQTLQSLSDALEDTTDILCHQLEVVPDVERQMLLHGWNATHQDYPAHLCIHHLFEQQVERTPHATALAFDDQTLTYSELNEHSNRLAHHLIALGVQPDTLVAICVERSFAMIVGVLAVLKAGGAYVPLDPSYASNRLRDVLTDASPNIVIADESGRVALGEESLSDMTVVDPNVFLDGSHGMTSHIEVPVSNPNVSWLTSRHLSYVIYTSGSTGKPKGVLIEHQGVVNLIYPRLKQFDIHSKSRVLQLPSLSFDFSVYDIFSALTGGASLHLIQDDVRLDQLELWSYVSRKSITHICITPSLIQDTKDIPELSTPLTFIIAGEALLTSVISNVHKAVPNGRIINEYGPTETTVIAANWECPREFKDDIVPIGRPLCNRAMYILDTHGRPVPLGAIGEMYIGGVGVARGYLNQPEMTAKVFLRDPFVDDANARMYKSGDLGRYLPDGNIVCLGRNDHQVKIRGFRIELGEIEARLVNHRLVDMATVTVMGDGSNKKLVAYVAAVADGELVGTLRSYLTSCLPDYMVPAAIVRLDAIPLTSNGKVDRKALPAPDIDAFVRQTYEEPQGETENAVARIWEELLNIEHVGRNDSFFALGGHSLLAVRLIERLRRIGLTMNIRTLFKNPTLCAFVRSLNSLQDLELPANSITPHTTTITPELLPLINISQSEIDNITKRVSGGVSNIQDIYALSPLQEGILFHHLLATEGDPYLLIASMVFDTREILDNYMNAIQRVVDRHDILRTAFMWENLSTPVQVVLRRAQLSITELQLDHCDGPVKDQLMQRLDPRKHRIDLNQAPLLRFTVAQDTDGRWIGVQLLHHLIGDHSTLDVMNTEIKAFMDGQGHTLRPPQPFRNLIAQSRSNQRQDDHDNFFSEMLSDIDIPSLPFGLEKVHGQGNDVTTSYRLLPQDLNDRLRKQAKRLGVSVATLCHLAWAIVISRTSGEDRVVFGTVLFGRMHSGIGADEAMGLFINTLPIRIDLTGSVREGVIRTHERLASLLEHEHASLVRAQQCSSVPHGTPLFSAMLNYRHNVVASDVDSAIQGIEHLEAHERTNYPLTLSVEDFGMELGLTADVVCPIDADRICGYMQQTLQSLSDALEDTTDILCHQLEVVPDVERQMLLHGWNATHQDYPAHLCIHHLFEQQVERTPHATALAFDDQTLTYSELNEHSNRLAHHLIALGVQPDTLVAICVERSLAMIVGVLAILKAGGAYVPLDPSYASSRLRDILTDASPNIVIADESGRVALGEESLIDKTVVDPNAILDGSHGMTSHIEIPVSNPNVSWLTSRHLSYVIYTSGSTGKPKGVLIEHQGVVNLIYPRLKQFDIHSKSRVLQLPSLSFDSSVSDIFSALTGGASLHLIQDDVRLDQRELWGYVSRKSITHICITPSLIQDTKDIPELSTPLTFIIAGETLLTSVISNVHKAVPNGRVINDYGPTETTVSASTYDCPQNFRDDRVPIGRPNPNKTIYILDARGLPVPHGAIGEIYIGGIGVARGYLSRPDLTAKVFLRDPFVDDANARMYKSGDLGRYLPDGNIICLGRNDHQVKIRGFRIELGEIEARLVEHPLVDMATVVVIGEGSDKKLVAYVVAPPNDQLVHTLRSHLQSCLPEYMVPAAFVRLRNLPLTTNGKLDRRCLPEPEVSSYANHFYEPPYGEMELALATIWRELLGIDKIGRNDNFFMLGGHSLMAVRMINQIKSLMGFKINLSVLFEAPTIVELVPRLFTAGNMQEDAFDVLLPIKPRGTRPPLFCVHHGFGLSWSYIGLAKHLHSDQPLYGLQVRGFFNNNSQPATTLEDMALDYIDQIRRIQPHGPYNLLGYSLGCMIAHTMAAHLERQGERVALLAAMDSVPKLHARPSEGPQEDQSEHARAFANRLMDAIPETTKPLLDRIQQTVQHLRRLGVNHSPLICNSGAILFRAMVQQDPTIQPISPDEWRPYVKGEVDVYDINSDHMGMDQPEPMAVIGGILARKLEEIEGSRKA